MSRFLLRSPTLQRQEPKDGTNTHGVAAEIIRNHPERLNPDGRPGTVDPRYPSLTFPIREKRLPAMAVEMALPPTIAPYQHLDLIRRAGPLWPPGDVALAHALFTVWAARTGRTLRAVPVTELTAGELLDFWADDQLDYPPFRATRRPLP
jgi:hypothetical protein